MDVEKTAAGFLFSFPESFGVTVTMDQIVKKGRAIHVRLDVRTAAPGYAPDLLKNVTTNLTSLTARQQLIRELAKRFDQAEWTGMIELVYAHALRVIDEGEPVLTIDPTIADSQDAPSATWRVSPLVRDAEPTILFGEGGACKSYLALTVGLMVETGMSVAGLTSVAGRVLFVDYEAEHDEFQRRAHLLAARQPDLEDGRPLYWRGTRPLADDLDKVAKLVAENDVKLLIVDSLGQACGAEDLFAAETATRYFAATRSLKVASLTIAHPQKNSETPSIYGSIFFHTRARAVWEVKRVHAPGASVTRIGCFNTKSNRGLLHPIGFAFTFADDGITVEPHDVFADQGLAHAQTVPSRLRHALAAGARTARELSEELAVPLNQVQVRLSQGKDDWCTKLGGDRWGLKS